MAAHHFVHGVKHAYFALKGVPSWDDPPRAVAEYLTPRLSPGDTIYVVDDEPIIYFLTRFRLPSRYVFPPFLLRRVRHAQHRRVEPREELERIMDQRPRYVIKRRIEAGSRLCPAGL